MLESRLQIDVSLTQRYILALLSLNAGITFLVSGPIGFLADKTGSKKAWLLTGLGFALASTFSVALATTSKAPPPFLFFSFHLLTGHIGFVLFTAQVVQALASSIIWVVGFSTIADNVDSEHMGKSYGAISMAVGVGTSAGPVLGGTLLELGGYWVAWSSAFSVIIIDIVLRLLMLEKQDNTGAGEYHPATSYYILRGNTLTKETPGEE